MAKKARARKQPITATARPAKLASTHQATQATISAFHTLNKRKARLKRILATEASSGSHSDAHAELQDVEREMGELGGLEVYQQASIKGQSVERGGDSAKVLIGWLRELGHDKLAAKGKLRLLELGALTPDNYASCSSWIDNTPMDLHSQHPDILERDFFDHPLPESQEEAYDVVSCSLVLNFVPETTDRGRMLQLIRAQLRDKSTSLLYLVLPAPCVSNSRYVSPTSLQSLMRAVGFEEVRSRVKPRGKVGYWLYRRVQPEGSSVEGFRRKVKVRDGPKCNNFAILLP